MDLTFVVRLMLGLLMLEVALGAETDAEDDPDDEDDEADEEGRGVLASDAKGKRGGRRDVATFGGRVTRIP